MKLSVIICVYNTARDYLTECLDGITCSTLKDLAGGYEICMVDDGSLTDYSDIVSKYGLKYLKTENRGILSARLTGVGMASGEYIVFCDSDDTVSHNYYLPMIERAEKSGADIVINDWAFYTPNMKYYCTNDATIKENIDLTGDDTLHLFTKNCGRQHSFYVLWNKLYRADILNKSFASLNEQGYPRDASYAEDAAINFFAWKYAKRVVNIHTGYYFYRIHPTQTVNATSEKRLLEQIEDMARCLRLMRDNVGNNIHRDEINENINAWASLMSRAHFALAKSNGYENLFPKIRELYGIKELRGPIFKDASDYIEKTLLGDNFSKIDSMLLALWNLKDVPNVKYRKKDTYTARCVENLIEHGKISVDKRKPVDIVIPKLKCSLKAKIIHNKCVYALGLIFFKKGSKIRGMLKKII